MCDRRVAATSCVRSIPEPSDEWACTLALRLEDNGDLSYDKVFWTDGSDAAEKA